MNVKLCISTSTYVPCATCLPLEGIMFTVTAMDDVHILCDVYHETASRVRRVSFTVTHCYNMCVRENFKP